MSSRGPFARPLPPSPSHKGRGRSSTSHSAVSPRRGPTFPLTRRGDARFSPCMRTMLILLALLTGLSARAGAVQVRDRSVPDQRRRAPALPGGRPGRRPHHRVRARLDHAGLDLAAADRGLRAGTTTSSPSIRAARATVRRAGHRLRPAPAAADDIAELIAHIGPAPVLLVGWSLGVLDTLAYVHAPRRRADSPAWCWWTIRSARSRRPCPPASRRTPARRCRAPVMMRHFVQGMFRHAARPGLSRPADRRHAAHAGAGQPRPAGLPGAAQLLARGGVFHRAGRCCTSCGPALAAQAANLQRNRPDTEIAVFRDAGHALFVDDAARFNALLGRISSAAGSGRDAPCWAAVPGLAVRRRLRDRADPLFRRREVVGIRLLGDLHRHGGLRAQRRGAGAVPRRVRPARPAGCWRCCRPADGGRRRWASISTTTNPFNPLQLQNPATWLPQLWNIAGYYAALLPFFFLAGLFVSLSFVLNAAPDRPGVRLRPDRRRRRRGAGAGR